MNNNQSFVDCDVCVLGAGIAGLNALYAVSRHLSPGDKVVLIDRREAPAGMWRTTYDYVRLHQPHPMFTVGNMRWRNQSDPYHLATRSEVVDHLQHCFEQVSGRAKLEAFFGYTYLRHEEQLNNAKLPVSVECRRESDGASLRVRARRLIKAFGYNVVPMAPLVCSSKQVRSLTPESVGLLQQLASNDSSAPIYIVGGGKTGMDTAQLLIGALPGRKIRMLIGDGTMFLDRDKTVPGRLRSHYAGKTGLEVFLDVAKRFNGHNEIQVTDHFRKNYCVSLDGTCRRYMFGLMSPAENRFVSQGLNEVIRDHIVDVIDEPRGPALVLRSGRRRAVEPGSVFVNCTGYLAARDAVYEPYLSDGGNVLSIQPTSTIHFLSSQSAYFLAHMLMLGKLRDAPLYEVGVAELRNSSRDVFSPTAITTTLYNTGVIVSRLPRWVHAENGLDLTALFPTHRRLLGLAKLMLFLRMHPDQLRDSLDVVRERFNVRLGLLRHAPQQAQPVYAHSVGARP